MTLFQATQSVDLSSALQSAFDILKGSTTDVLVQSKQEFKVANGDGSIVLDLHSVGHSFSYHHHGHHGSGQGPSQGNLASLEVDIGGPGAASIAYEFSGMHVSVARVNADIAQGKWGALLNLFLHGHDHINGSSDNDYLTGHAGHETINSGAGNDTMDFSSRHDTFVFGAGLGTDEITHFATGPGHNHDIIDLQGLGVSSFADLQASHLSVVSGDVVITIGFGSITLDNVHSISDLAARDFLFS